MIQNIGHGVGRLKGRNQPFGPTHDLDGLEDLTIEGITGPNPTRLAEV